MYIFVDILSFPYCYTLDSKLPVFLRNYDLKIKKIQKMLISHWSADKSYITTGLESNQKTEDSETEIFAGN